MDQKAGVYPVKICNLGGDLSLKKGDSFSLLQKKGNSRFHTSCLTSPDARFELATNGLTVRREPTMYNNRQYVAIGKSKT